MPAPCRPSVHDTDDARVEKPKGRAMPGPWPLAPKRRAYSSFDATSLPFDGVLEHRDSSVVGAADAGADGRRVAAGTDGRNRRHLRDEDQVALGVRRDRMRAGGLRDVARLAHPFCGTKKSSVRRPVAPIAETNPRSANITLDLNKPTRGPGFTRSTIKYRLPK